MLRTGRQSVIFFIVVTVLAFSSADRSVGWPLPVTALTAAPADFDQPPPPPRPPEDELGAPADRVPDWIDDDTFAPRHRREHQRFRDRQRPAPRRVDKQRRPARQRGPRRPVKPRDDRGVHPMVGVGAALKNMDALVEFYERHERWEDVERVLKQRVEIPLRLVELRILGERLGPETALREYYHATGRPHRALETELAILERDAKELDARKAALEARSARLHERRKELERRSHNLRQHRERLEKELREVHRRAEAERAQELETATREVPEDIKWLTTEQTRFEDALTSENLSPERRVDTENRCRCVTEELRELQRRGRHVHRELEQYRAEKQHRRKRERAETTRNLREELRHLQGEKQEARKELQHIREELEGRVTHLDKRIQSIKKRLERMSKGPAGNKPPADSL